MMKLFYLSSVEVPSSRANSIQIMKMCEAFSQLGHEVFLSTPTREVHADALWTYYGVKSPFTIYSIPASPGIARHVYAIKSAWAAKKLECDAVYGRFLPGLAYAAVLGLPVIYEMHQPLTGITTDFYFNRLLSSNFLRGLVSITDSLKVAVIEKIGSRLESIPFIVEPDGVDLERYANTVTREESRKRLKIEENCFLAVYTGQLYSGKGVDLILNIAAKCKSLQFLIVGGEEQQITKYQRYCQEREIANVSWCGFVNPSEVIYYQYAADALLLPNQIYVAGSSGGDIGRWTSPLKMFEYMASGRPIVTSNLMVLREVLTEETSIFCDPASSDEWVQALKFIRDNPIACHLMGEKARIVTEKFTWISRAQRCLSLFQ